MSSTRRVREDSAAMMTTIGLQFYRLQFVLSCTSMLTSLGELLKMLLKLMIGYNSIVNWGQLWCDSDTHSSRFSPYNTLFWFTRFRSYAQFLVCLNRFADIQRKAKTLHVMHQLSVLRILLTTHTYFIVFLIFTKTCGMCLFDSLSFVWRIGLQVEYTEYFSGQVSYAVAEAPKEALPHNCRPDFGAAWSTTLKFKVFQYELSSSL